MQIFVVKLLEQELPGWMVTRDVAGRGANRRVVSKFFLQIQDETLLVPLVLVRKGLSCSAARVGFSTP
jgi:hypothetical protein